MAFCAQPGSQAMGQSVKPATVTPLWPSGRNVYGFLLGGPRVLAKDTNAQNEPCRELAQGQAQTNGHLAFPFIALVPAQIFPITP